MLPHMWPEQNIAWMKLPRSVTDENSLHIAIWGSALLNFYHSCVFLGFLQKKGQDHSSRFWENSWKLDLVLTTHAATRCCEPHLKFNIPQSSDPITGKLSPVPHTLSPWAQYTSHNLRITACHLCSLLSIKLREMLTLQVSCWSWKHFKISLKITS